jgi:hypothetical protein
MPDTPDPGNDWTDQPYDMAGDGSWGPFPQDKTDTSLFWRNSLLRHPMPPDTNQAPYHLPFNLETPGRGTKDNQIIHREGGNPYDLKMMIKPHPVKNSNLDELFTYLSPKEIQDIEDWLSGVFA